MNKLTIKDISLKGKKLLIRVDFNVPLDESGNITDDIRIQAALPTIKYALEQGAALILMSHLGRPKGEVKPEFSLKPASKRLGELLSKDVKQLNDSIGDEVKSAISAIKPGEVIMLENLRFHKEEKKNDPDFAKELASYGDVYCNDAFGTAHRAHASTAGVTQYLESCAGFLLQKEIEYIGGTLENPKRPFVAILGGAKVSDKIPIIDNLLNKVDKILIGGGMAYTFLKTQGKTIGNSKLEEDSLKIAKASLIKAKEKGIEILLPIDHLIVENIDPAANVEVCGEDIPDGKIAVDIGPETIKLFSTALDDAQTVIWNGPSGIFEMDAFSKGTEAIARKLTKINAVTIIGGGDTAAAVKKFGLENKMSHISTGGGASLEYLEGKVLPGIAALTEKK